MQPEHAGKWPAEGRYLASGVHSWGSFTPHHTRNQALKLHQNQASIKFAAKPSEPVHAS